MIRLWFWLCVLSMIQILDIVTTNMVKSLEINPAVLFLFVQLGSAWWAPKIFMLIAVIVMSLKAAKVTRLGFCFMAFYSVVISLNLVNVVVKYLI